MLLAIEDYRLISCNCKWGAVVQVASDNSKLIRSVDPFRMRLPVSERRLRPQRFGCISGPFVRSEQAGPRAAGLFTIRAFQAPRRPPHRETPHGEQAVRTRGRFILIAVVERLSPLVPTFLAPLLSILATFLSDRLPVSKIPVAKRRKSRKA